MRVERVEACAVSIPLTRDFGGSTYHVDRRCTVVTRVYADGLVAQVYNGDNREHGPEIVRIIHEHLAPLLVGQDIAGVERAWETMFATTIAFADRKIMAEAIACVDCALWDLIGKATGRRVSELLGGYCDELPIISIGGYYLEGKSVADCGREVESYRAAGMAGCKFKVGGLRPEEDYRRVAAARDAVGDDFVIMADANRGWNVADATRFARLVEPLDIVWFEEPCHWYDDCAMMAEVRKSIRIPIAAGQSEVTSFGVRRLVEGRAVDYVNYDASEGCGVTDWRRAAAICGAFGVGVAHHEESQISTHLLCSIPHGTYVECFADPERDPVWQHLWANRPAVKNGRFPISQGAGFGIELDETLIRKYRVA